MSVPLIELAPLPNVLVDVGAWAAVHAGTGYAVHRLPIRWLDHDGGLLRIRGFENGGRIYERLGIRRWKDRLPEAGAVFAGGVSKRSLPSVADGGLERFAAETRRAELGHWLAMAAGPLFVVWNPLPIAAVMVAYGVIANAPFIAIQRYNRARVSRCVERRSRLGSATGATAPRRPADMSGNSMP
jgi:glycosyl-4,4'-diaponeurosporenoate acyltransferase